MRYIARILRALFVGALFVLPISQVYASSASSDTVPSLNYLAQHQDSATGGIFENGDAQTSAMLSGWTAVAFASAGYDPDSVGNGIVNYINKDACQLTSATDIERTILAVSSAGLDASDFGSCDLLTKLNALTDISTGIVGNGLVSTVFGVLAVRSQDKLVGDATIEYIVNSQADDGGWSSGWGTEANITAQTIMALISAEYDKSSPTIIKAKQYLKNLQTDTGGIKYDSNGWTTESDAFSSAYTLQAIYALGEDPRSDYWTRNNKSLIDDLASLRQTDGSYNFSQGLGAMNPVFTTSIVLPAINGKTMPIIGKNLVGFKSPIVKQETPKPTSPTPGDETAKSADVALNTTQASSAPTLEDYTRGDVALSTNETDTSAPAQNEKIDARAATSPPNPPRNKNYANVLIYSGGLLLGVALSFVLGRVSILPLLIMMIMIPAIAMASRAGVIARHGNGNIVKRCVDFNAPTITGLELLRDAGLSPVLENGFVVSVDGDKAKSSTDSGVTSDYWSYWQLDNKWIYSRAGATSSKIHDGDVDGWQRGGSSLLLPLVKFDDICSRRDENVAVATTTTSPNSPVSGGETSRGSVGIDSSSPTASSTTTSAIAQANINTSSPVDTYAKDDSNRTNYTNVLLFAGLLIAGFIAHRLFKKMRGSK